MNVHTDRLKGMLVAIAGFQLLVFGGVPGWTQDTPGQIQSEKKVSESQVQERAIPVLEPQLPSERKLITSRSACQRLNLEFDAKNNLCLKSEGARPPQQSASSAQSPQQQCHNACVQAVSNVGGTLWYSGLDEMGNCLCAICDISIPGITRLFGKTFCNVFSLGHCHHPKDRTLGQ